MKNTKFEWNAKRITQLRSLWLSGMPTVKIAATMGTSKGSVIGKANRINLPSRKVSDTGRNLKAKRSARSTVKRPSYKWVTQGVNPKPLCDIQRNDCRWPITDDKPFMFCGGKRENDQRPYCDKHNAIAYELKKNSSVKQP